MGPCGCSSGSSTRHREEARAQGYGDPRLALPVEDLLEGRDLDDLDLRLALAYDAAVFLDDLAQLATHPLGAALLGQGNLAGQGVLGGPLRRRALLHHCTARRSTV